MATNSNVEVNVQGNNQQTPNTTPEISEALRSHSVCLTCPSCRAVQTTNPVYSINIVTCLLAYFCTEFFCCWRMWKRKDYNCSNAEHNCGQCGAYIDTYNSCS